MATAGRARPVPGQASATLPQPGSLARSAGRPWWPATRSCAAHSRHMAYPGGSCTRSGRKPSARCLPPSSWQRLRSAPSSATGSVPSTRRPSSPGSAPVRSESRSGGDQVWTRCAWAGTAVNTASAAKTMRRTETKAGAADRGGPGGPAGTRTDRERGRKTGIGMVWDLLAAPGGTKGRSLQGAPAGSKVATFHPAARDAAEAWILHGSR